LPIAKVTRDEIEAVRDALDEAITKHTRTEGKEGIGTKRAQNVWSVVTTTFKAACMSKCRASFLGGHGRRIGFPASVKRRAAQITGRPR
jgi:hypothetical protein